MSATMSTIVYGSLAGIATVAGMSLVLRFETWSRRRSVHLISFAAGALVAAAFLELLPEAAELAGSVERSFLPALVAFLVLYVLEHNLHLHAHHEEEHRPHPIGIVAVTGMTFHSLLDGIAIGIGFEIDPALGVIAAFAVISHELPEGLSVTSVLLHAGHTRAQSILLASVVALATPVGALVSLAFVSRISPDVLGPLLGAAAGSFIYVAASDLIPETHRTAGWPTGLLVLAGAASTFGLDRLLAH